MSPIRGALRDLTKHEQEVYKDCFPDRQVPAKWEEPHEHYFGRFWTLDELMAVGWKDEPTSYRDKFGLKVMR